MEVDDEEDEEDEDDESIEDDDDKNVAVARFPLVTLKRVRIHGPSADPFRSLLLFLAGVTVKFA